MSDRLPNILLIVCDTLGAKHMSLYGYHRKTTPMIERMVEEENFTVYTRCFSPAPWTVPSHASLFTGLYPSEHGTYGINMFMNPKIITITEILKETGYRTYGLSCNPLICDFFGFGKGFDKFYEMWNFFYEDSSVYNKSTVNGTSISKLKFLITRLVELQNNRPSDYSKIIKQLFVLIFNVIWKQVRPIQKNSSPYTIKTLKKAISILYNSDIDKKPLFMFINLMQTHDKYVPPKAFRNVFIEDNRIYKKRHYRESEYVHYTERPFESKYIEYLEAQYDQEVLFLDYVIWKFYNKIKNVIPMDNTIFIITSDHGELFGEHGHIHHLFTTYNELIHVPLIIKYPRNSSVNARLNNNLVQLNDIYATLLDLTDNPYPKPQSSVSLIGAERRRFAFSQLLDIGFKIEACLKRNPKFSVEMYPTISTEISIINDRFLKFIKRDNGQNELYNLAEDFYETNNLLADGVINDVIMGHND